MVSIIIPVYNNLKYTQTCLEALKKTINGIEYEVVVVDNGSTDETPVFFKNLKDKTVNYIRLEKNYGFAKACNIGAKKAKGEVLVFLNNDTVPLRGWLDPIVEAVDERTITGSLLLYPDMTVQHAGVVATDLNTVIHIYREFPSEFPGVQKRREFNIVTGACMGILKKRFFNLGMFDERFINGFEDVDLCLRNRKFGGRCLYLPESRIIHYESKTKGRFKKTSENTELLTEKWGSLEPDVNRVAAEDGVVVRYVREPGGIIVCFMLPFLNPHKRTVLEIIELFEKGSFKEAAQAALNFLPGIPYADVLLLKALSLFILGKGTEALEILYSFEPGETLSSLLKNLGVWRPELSKFNEVFVEKRRIFPRDEYKEILINRVKSDEVPINVRLFFLEKLKTLSPGMYMELSETILDDGEELLKRKKLLNIGRIFSWRINSFL